MFYIFYNCFKIDNIYMYIKIINYYKIIHKIILLIRLQIILFIDKFMVFMIKNICFSYFIIFSLFSLTASPHFNILYIHHLAHYIVSYCYSLSRYCIVVHRELRRFWSLGRRFLLLFLHIRLGLGLLNLRSRRYWNWVTFNLLAFIVWISGWIWGIILSY
jgi:hypothetical protein